MSIPAPVISRVMEVEKQWIDYNGHMNMAYHNVLFDRSADEAFEIMGLGPDYARDRRLTSYTAEVHISYVRELHLGDKVTVSFQLIDADDKRFHFYQEIFHEEGWLAATSEALSLHIDMSGPKVSAFPPDTAKKVAAMKAAHSSLPRPERAGRSIGIKRKIA